MLFTIVVSYLAIGILLLMLVWFCAFILLPWGFRKGHLSYELRPADRKIIRSWVAQFAMVFLWPVAIFWAMSGAVYGDE